MSFDLIASKHTRDNKGFAPRTHDLNLLLRVVAPELNGGIYDLTKGRQLYPWHTETIGGKYVSTIDRKPNVPEGTNTVRGQVYRQAEMLFGPDHFPAIDTSNESARKALTDFIEEAQVAEREREGVVLGSVGSLAKHIRCLAPEGQPARIYVENYPTSYLTPTFDPYRPDTLIAIREKYKVKGAALRELRYVIKDEDLTKDFWFMRDWDLNSEIWYLPWTPDDEKDENFSPHIDNQIDHNLGICPWLWTRNLPIGNGIDGTCQFKSALDHAINLDYLQSQITSAIKYSMSPTLVIEKPAAAAGAPATNATSGDAGKAPNMILIIDAQGKAYYVEIDAAGIEMARQVANDLRKAIIVCMRGDGLDPEKITQAHQGAKSIAMIQKPFLGLCDQLKSSYGNTLKRQLKMVLQIIEIRAEQGLPGVEINGEVIDAATMGKVSDLKLMWGPYYADTPTDLYQQAQALDLNLRNGLLSQERAMSTIAPDYNISNIEEEQAKVKVDQAAILAREIQLGQSLKATAQMPNG
jgi:hypothetical protein